MRLDPVVATAFQVAVVAIVALVGIAALRWAASLAAGHILGHEADTDPLLVAERAKRVRTIQHLVTRVGTVVIVVLALLTLLSQFGVDIGPAVAGLGVAGLALGLGAQALVRDWLAGIFILAENQFSRGDHVQIAGVRGVVEELGLRRTVLRDLDGAVHTVPNGQIAVASNLTRLWSSVNLDLEVAHGTDLDAVSERLDRVGAELAADPEWRGRVIEPPRAERVEAIAPGGVTLKVLGRVRAGEQWAVTGELRRRIVAAFANAGGSPAYPLHIGGAELRIGGEGPGAVDGEAVEPR
jgi:small-conductance mechanosensitive channel